MFSVQMIQQYHHTMNQGPKALGHGETTRQRVLKLLLMNKKHIIATKGNGESRMCATHDIKQPTTDTHHVE